MSPVTRALFGKFQGTFAHSSMRSLGRAIVVLFTGSLLMVQWGCSTLVMNDYPQYLSNNTGTGFPSTGLKLGYEITEETKTHSVGIRSWQAGIANKWVIEFGKVLDATIKSADFSKAFAGIEADDKKAPLQFTFALVSYTFADAKATVELHIKAQYQNKAIVDKTYKEIGNRQAGKMFWGGGLAMKNAIQQSTKAAMDAILVQFLKDVTAQTKSAAANEPLTGAVASQP